ncbi:MAG: T9SS C-terminal target domain-containing protein [Ignavibacteriae bacterium]|nr:MAG: T9SS C-terminal target domain-containing protein [Ignavibacteriota bacterium]
MNLRLVIFSVILLLNPFILHGQKMDSSFIRGADVSFTQQIEDLGGKYYLHGVEKDALDIMKENGVNYIRLRLWHTPSNGYCGTAKTLEYAKRVKAKGLKLLLDFHYSDWWADPGKQNKPAAWINISYDALKDSVYSYTKKTIEAFRSQNVIPDMVQIGNEIPSGMLWNDGRVGGSYDSNWPHLGELLKEGIRGARDAMIDTTIKIMIHIDKGGNNSTARWFYDNLKAQGVQYDVIGLSYYPWWHGTMATMQANLNDLSVRYNKEIVIAETAYPWTTQYLNDGMPDVGLGTWNPPAGYPITIQGQKAFLFTLTNIIKETANGKGVGYFYWEPAYIPISPIGSSWEHFTTFDYTGNALSTITAFMNFDTMKAVKVKLRINTSTNPDTLKPSGVVQVRGDINGLGSNLLPSGELISGDANTQMLPKNVGGDYWEYQFSMYPADRFEYKLWTGHTGTQQTYWNIGYEGKILTYDNSTLNTRLFIAGNQDTVVPIQYYSNSLDANFPQYWSPFQPRQDSLGVFFRINAADLMAKGLFDPAAQGPIAVRGDSIASAGVLSWTSDKLILSREPAGVAGESFWSGIGYFPKSVIAAGTQIKFKYYIAKSTFGGWESNISERSFAFPQSDTTLTWQFFNNKLSPTGVEEPSGQIPSESQLYQNYPNPFNPATTIRYLLARRSAVTLSIVNILGQTVSVLVDGKQELGEHAVEWNVQHTFIPSGVYFVRLTADGAPFMRKIMLVK